MATNPLEGRRSLLFGDLLKEVLAGHQVYEMPVGDRSSGTSFGSITVARLRTGSMSPGSSSG